MPLIFKLKINKNFTNQQRNVDFKCWPINVYQVS